MAEGLRVYAIGDIHGRLDLFEAMLEAIDQDDRARTPAQTHLILLGDLIDRGPQSAQVVARAIEIERSTENAHFLLGNHEEVLLKAIEEDTRALSLFHRIGGRETALSYGISEQAYWESDYSQLRALLLDHVPEDHIAFFKRCEDLVIFGDYAFVHAGIRPSVSLAMQRSNDLRWIRNEFLDHKGSFEKIIVHGHSISADIEMRSQRIGLDTGAYESGKLSAMGFEGNERWPLQVVLA